MMVLVMLRLFRLFVSRLGFLMAMAELHFGFYALFVGIF